MAARSKSGLALAGILVLVAVALAIPAADAHASLLGLGNNCGAASQPFAPFGDYRYYTFGTDGGLEAGGAGWTLGGGARVVAGNETFYVHSRSDSRSLSLAPGSSVLTAPMCMGTTSTFIRFFVKNSVPGSLRVQVVLRGLLGGVIGVLDWTTISGTSSWKPGPAVLNLDSLLGLLGVSSIQLKFTSSGGAWQVDDLYVDPWKARG